MPLHSVNEVEIELMHGFNIYLMCMCAFVCRHVYVPCMYLMPREARISDRLELEAQMVMGGWMLGSESGSSVRATSSLTSPSPHPIMQGFVHTKGIVCQLSYAFSLPGSF